MVDQQSTISRLTHANNYMNNQPLATPSKESPKFNFSSNKANGMADRVAQVTASVPRRIFVDGN